MNGLVGYVAPYDIEYGYGFRPYAGSSIEQKAGLLDIHIPYMHLCMSMMQNCIVIDLT